MKTLTPLGFEKIVQRFVTSISHVAYTHNGDNKTTALLNTVVEDDIVKFYVYFDDTVSGAISNVSLVDVDGDVVAQVEQSFTKPTDKGLYVVFKYRFHEMEVDRV